MTDSPFQSTEASGKRLKLLAWGDTGVGKTTLAKSFPGVALIDMDDGSRHYKGFDVLRATDADSIMAAVDWLLKGKHEYRSLVIDPITIYWDALQRKWSDIFLNRNKGGKGYKFEFYDMQPKDWITLKSEHKELLRKLIQLDMNVIVTAREKTLFSDDGGMKKLGETFDGEKSLPYLFDTVVRLYRGSGGSYMTNVKKDRTGLLPKEDFPTSYSVFAHAFGLDNLERAPKQDPLASDEMKAQLHVLAGILAMSDERLLAGLRGIAKCEGWDDLTESGAAKIEAELTKRVTVATKKETV